MKSNARLTAPLAVVLVACGASNANLEFDAQENAATHEAPPVSSSPPPRAVEAPVAPEVAAPKAVEPSYAAEACPLQCIIADGRHREPVAPVDLQKLRSALGPTMGGLRQCTASNGRDDSRKSATVNLRFGSSGQLLDVGADPTGYDANVADCMEQVVRGSANPVIAFDGPATIRCTEKCDRSVGVFRR